MPVADVKQVQILVLVSTRTNPLPPFGEHDYAKAETVENEEALERCQLASCYFANGDVYEYIREPELLTSQH